MVTLIRTLKRVNRSESAKMVIATVAQTPDDVAASQTIHHDRKLKKTATNVTDAHKSNEKERAPSDNTK